MTFDENNQINSDLIGVLFQITVDSSILSNPFANMNKVSHFQTEKEILFSVHSVFRIGQIIQMDENNRIWEVNLSLTSDNDPQLHALIEHIRDKTFPTAKG